MANSSSSAESIPSNFNQAAGSQRYIKIAAKNKWEEQGFYFDDAKANYGLEPIIYKRLSDLGWFRFARQPARANLNWVLEFYTNNAAGEDTVSIRGKRVPANSATINNILDLPNDSPSIYELIELLEEEDLDTIKDQLCEPGTAWNVRGKNPKTISRPHLQPEAKLWNTFVKRNLMPTSHNQTMDHTRLVLINAIITGYKFNVGEVIPMELSAACQNDKGILAFPYIISALCRRAVVPAQPADKYTLEKAGWTRKEYMRKMEVADAVPIQMAMPTPPASEQPEPVAPTGRAPSPTATPPAAPAPSPAPTPAATPATQDSRQSTPASPMGSAPIPRPSPPLAQSEEAAPIHILQLRSQLQRIEAQQLQHIEEVKVFRNSLVQFLYFQFPSTAAFFSTPPPTAQPAPAPAQQTPPTDPSEGAGNTEQLHLSEEDIFDWHTPMEHQSQLKQADIPGSFKADDAPAHAEPPATQEHTPRRRGKTPAKRIVLSDRSSSPDQPEQQPAKRMQRRNIWSISYGKKKLHFKEYMIQGFLPKPNPLEVPGNRLPETGSRRTLPPARGAWFPARSDQPQQEKEATVIRSCADAARTKDPELTQAGNSSTCRSTHLGRQGKYNRECDKISIFFQQTLDLERTKSRPKTICRTNPKPKHTKSTWSISLSREKSCFIKIT
ncbi:hypothetical protein V6N12_013259 [Hibiscus sabdariffa]|uniref:Putative plant transposon protein domain-containing protein n=1 Tax=Hibiscus sabdariffa TaxID=183260 RepID=A0ABR2D6D2_9ROSI